MPTPRSFGTIDVTLQATMEAARGSVTPETPFRVALLGDFSNRASRGLPPRSVAELRQLRPRRIDRDTFEAVMADMAVDVPLPPAMVTSTQETLRCTCLEDFHPDHLYARLDAFRLLRELRRRLDNPQTFAAAAAELQALHGPIVASAAEATPSPTAAPAPELAALSPGDLLEHILGEDPGQTTPAPPVSSGGEWRAFLQKIVAPHLLPSPHPQRAALVAQVEAIISAQMRALLHTPAWQAAEALWRATFFLVNRVETSVQLQLYVFDISADEFVADLRATENLQATALYRLLVAPSVETLGGTPWAVVAGHYTFSATEADVLGRMAQITQHAGAPFLAAAHPQIVGCAALATTPDPDDWRQALAPEEHEAWQALRRLPEARYLGLAVPRFILRLPYGRDTEPVESFTFAEADGPLAHEAYLWGNPAFACVYLLAEAFSRDGWHLRPGSIQDISNLPLHIYQDSSETLIKPCAETWLTERAVERLLEAGLMPLVSMKNQDVVRLARWQSLAQPLSRLAGRWQA